MNLHTIGSALRDAAALIGSISDTARLDAEVLLARVTGKTRAHFFAWLDRELGGVEAAEFRALVQKRCDGIPIAYLTGMREFWSREFAVTPDVLIPRPETELLVELALERIPVDRPVSIADLGTGSGALAVTLALERPLAQVTALDLSPAAIAVAKHNAESLGASNVRFVVSDWFSALGKEERFDLIVSNPPYIAHGDPHLSEGDVRFEPESALSSGPDGLDDIRRITRDAPGYLNERGWLLFEHGFDQADAARAILHNANFIDIASHRDWQGHDRTTTGRKRPALESTI
ncbi:MAG: release factor glutamine methyltransferase [Proteobacteria bacterium]|nr:release factor glutamine methyltransferase [Pseudomonadota bacterium]